MGTNLLFTGRAGSGKTRAILERLVALARTGRLDEALLLLPTQSQVDHLRGVLLREGVGAIRDDFAHTFFTLSRTLAGGMPERLLTEAGKDYLLRDVLRLEPLPSFEAIRETRGFRTLLRAAIKELKQNGVRPTDYSRRILASLGGARGARQRHRDLGSALQAYEARLLEIGRIDQEDLELAALARLESEAGLLAGKKLFLVDGFHDFTLVQLRMVVSLARRFPRCVITLSWDASRPASPAFQASRATRDAILSMGFAEQSLQGNRRTEDATLRHLEAALFEEPSPAAPAGDSLRLLHCARREDEVESIARRIVRLVREEGVPYRDIAVLYHDLGEVTGLLEGTFRRFDIPLRIYQPRTLDRHPLAGFLLDLGSTLAQGPARETMLRLLRSGYIEGLNPAEVDRLDQRVREQGAPGSGHEWSQLCDALHLPGIAGVLHKLKRAGDATRGKHTHDSLSAAWTACFEDLALPLGERGPGGPSDGAAYREFQSLLEAARVLHDGGKAPITLGLLVEIIREGTAQATFRRQDRRREVVNAINAFEARQWEVPYLFVANVLERQFPPAPLEDLFFDDSERRMLNAAGMRFPDRGWRQSEERFLFYMAVTRARRRLVLSHARSDSRGNPTLASFFIREVEKLFTPDSLARQSSERSPSEVLPPPEEMVSLEDVDRAVFLGLEERFPAGVMPARIALAGALYQERRGAADFLAWLDRLFPDRRARLTAPAVLQEIAHRDTAFSNSALTAFLQCPYLHFTQKWLRLGTLPQAQITPLDLGKILHDTLKDFLETAGDGDPYRLLEENFEKLSRARAATFRSRSDYWRLRAALGEVLEAEKIRQREAKLRPRLFEVPFGLGDGSGKPGVPIQAGNREERLSGIIDRIDTDATGRSGYVVDYKYSGPKRVRDQFQASLGEEMENFQLPIYLLALRESLGMEAAGAELLSVRNGVERFAMGRAALADLWGAPAKAQRLEEAQFEAYLARARDVMARLITAARAGDIETRPKHLESCGPGACVAADVCRFDRWIGGQSPGD